MKLNKPLFVVIYPYKFSDFIWQYYELDAFELFCDVEVWDLSLFSSSEFSKSISSPRSVKKQVVALPSLWDFFKQISKLKERAPNNYFILNLLSNGSFSGLLLSIFLLLFSNKKLNRIIDIRNGGLPEYYSIKEQNTKEQESYIKRIRKAFILSSSFLEFRKKVKSYILLKLSSIIATSTTHRLVAGQHSMMSSLDKKVEIVLGHCQDYSNFFLKETLSPIGISTQKSYAVLLDAPGPLFVSDYSHLGRKVFLTSDIWYPALTHFFEKLETQTGVDVKVAGHYKSTHPFLAPCFGNREVHYNKTAELVKNCAFVITRSSAAISYAVLFKKPIIFIYSDQLKNDELAMYHAEGMAQMLGTEPINIDNSPDSIKSFLEVNETLYEEYQKACLTSTDIAKPNVQIILEEIMQINTGSTFIKNEIKHIPA